MERPTLIQEIQKIILWCAKPQRIYFYGSEATGIDAPNLFEVGQ